MKLDHHILERVHTLLGFPFRPNTTIATLPISLHGFDFPSIARINQAIAISGLSRDLNHHIPAYRAMACITMADWMCEKNSCRSPIDDDTQVESMPSSIYMKSIPAEWVIARKAMKAFKPPLVLRNTDQSFLMDSEVSISHILKVSSDDHPQIAKSVDGNALRSLRSKGFLKIKDIGFWTIRENGHIQLQLNHIQFDQTWSTSARTNWEKVNSALNLVRLERVVRGPIELAIDRARRKRKAEALLHSLASIIKFPRSREAGNLDNLWASDGSMVPAAVSITEPKTIIGAATGPSTLALKVLGLNASILHGELAGIITAMILSCGSSGAQQYQRDKGSRPARLEPLEVCFLISVYFLFF